MKTICYVDGFNLFYGCLKHSEFKWLDLVHLIKNQILHSQSPQSELIVVKFFTANIRAKLASRGSLAEKSQQDYHRALERCYPDKIKIIKGYYSTPKQEWMLNYVKPPSKAQRVPVWRMEEKQTDVNIAIEAYRDAAKGNAEHQVFISNDSDLEPALNAIKEDFSDIQIGLIMPVRFNNESGVTKQHDNKRLSKHADWTRRYITEDELSASQLPVKVPTKKKPIIKPEYW